MTCFTVQLPVLYNLLLLLSNDWRLKEEILVKAHSFLLKRACPCVVHTFVKVWEQILIETSVFGQHEQEGETEKQLHRFVLHRASLSLTAWNQRINSHLGPDIASVLHFLRT